MLLILKVLSVTAVTYAMLYCQIMMAEPTANTDGFPFQGEICEWVEFALKSIKSTLTTH